MFAIRMHNVDILKMTFCSVANEFDINRQSKPTESAVFIA